MSLPTADFDGLWPGAAPVDIVHWDLTTPPPASPELVVLPVRARPDLTWLGQLDGLRAVLTLSVGIEHVVPFVPPGVALCNAAGVHDASTAETAIGLALCALRGIGRHTPADVAGAGWPPPFRPSLADRRVLVLGAGGVGTAVAARLAPFEVGVTRVGRRARDDGTGHVHAAAELPALLPRHDVVIAALPLTGETRGLVDAAFLARLPDGALLVNVGRGPVVDTAALVAEARTGRLLAALDVTDPEPLPADHPLWQCPEVVVTPHIGGSSSAFLPRARSLVRDQAERLASTRPLRNTTLLPEPHPPA